MRSGNLLATWVARLLSSVFPSEESLKAEARVLELCSGLVATRYINPFGGLELYYADHSAAHGIELCFLQVKTIAYPQTGTSEFVPFLSIIDVAMNNPVEKIREMLLEFDALESIT